MTQSNTDPWAAAQAQVSGNQAGSQAGQGIMPDQSNPGLGGGSLFGGGGKRLPSLFNRTHGAGTVRGGEIIDVKDVHSREFTREEGPGELRYWEDGNSGKGVRPVTYPVSKITGKPNRPVMDTHLTLKTDYRLSPEEIGALKRDPDDAKSDNGDRVFVINNLRDAQEAIATWNKDNPGKAITSPAELIGRKIEVKRMTAPGENGQAYPMRFVG